jgi:hypothetical protein
MPDFRIKIIKKFSALGGLRTFEKKKAFLAIF